RRSAPHRALGARTGRRQRRIQGTPRRQAARSAPRRNRRLRRRAPGDAMRRLAAPLLVLLLGLAPLQAIAGAQIYEPLATSVRDRLSARVSDRAPANMVFRSNDDAQRWLGDMERRLER